jgi:predicted Zn-dependent protease
MLRYAIANGDVVTEDAINCGHIRQPSKLLSASGIDRAAFRAATREGFARWQQVANIVFVEVGSVENADIVVGEQASPEGIAFTNVTIGNPIDASARAIKKAQICLNPSRKWKVGFDGNIAVPDLVHVITHEIGHAIGLDHPSARGQIMSFRYQETLDGLTEGDRMGAVALYGRKQTTSSAAQHAGRFVSRDDAPSTH